MQRKIDDIEAQLTSLLETAIAKMDKDVFIITFAYIRSTPYKHICKYALDKAALANREDICNYLIMHFPCTISSNTKHSPHLKENIKKMLRDLKYHPIKHKVTGEELFFSDSLKKSTPAFCSSDQISERVDEINYILDECPELVTSSLDLRENPVAPIEFAISNCFPVITDTLLKRGAKLPENFMVLACSNLETLCHLAGSPLASQSSPLSNAKAIGTLMRTSHSNPSKLSIIETMTQLKFDISFEENKLTLTGIALYYFPSALPLMLKFIDVNALNLNGQTLLHQVIARTGEITFDQQIKLLRILFEYNPDPSVKNSDGLSAIAYAYQKSEHIAAYLIMQYVLARSNNNVDSLLPYFTELKTIQAETAEMSEELRKLCLRGLRNKKSQLAETISSASTVKQQLHRFELPEEEKYRTSIDELTGEMDKKIKSIEDLIEVFTKSAIDKLPDLMKQHQSQFVLTEDGIKWLSELCNPIINSLESKFYSYLQRLEEAKSKVLPLLEKSSAEFASHPQIRTSILPLTNMAYQKEMLFHMFLLERHERKQAAEKDRSLSQARTVALFGTSSGTPERPAQSAGYTKKHL